MENQTIFKAIPGYENYGVSKDGQIISFVRGTLLSQFMLNGYYAVTTGRGSLTETLPIHRAVALAWVERDDPEKYPIVNHIDGDPTNNWFENLEWTDYSGNAYHAIANGMRPDNIRCKLRNFYTKEVLSFASMAQAAEYMGLKKDTHASTLNPKMFGRLVCGKFEFKYEQDTTPWFYETRTELIKPVRFIAQVTFPDKSFKEIYSNKRFMKEFQLYKCPYGSSMFSLARYASELFEDHQFVVLDSYMQGKVRVMRKQLSVKTPVTATNGPTELCFDSLTKCARHFNIDKKTVLAKASTGSKLGEWIFSLSQP